MTTEQLRALHAKTTGQLQERLAAIISDFDCYARYSRWEIERAAEKARAAAHEHWLPLLDEIDRLRGEGPSEADLERAARAHFEVRNPPGARAYAGWDDLGHHNRLDRIETMRAAIVALRSSGPTEETPVKMLVDNEWLRRKIETDPDLDVEAGVSTEEIRGSDSDVEKPTPGASSAPTELAEADAPDQFVSALATSVREINRVIASGMHERYALQIAANGLWRFLANGALASGVDPSPATSEPPPSPPRAHVPEGFRPIDDSTPRDRLIDVWAPSNHGLPPIVSACQWHPDAGFCVDELREPTHWRERWSPPSPPDERTTGGALSSMRAALADLEQRERDARDNIVKFHASGSVWGAGFDQGVCTAYRNAAGVIRDLLTDDDNGSSGVDSSVGQTPSNKRIGELEAALRAIRDYQPGTKVGAGDGDTYVLTGHEYLDCQEIARQALQGPSHD